MNFSEFEKFRNENNLQFILYTTKRLSIKNKKKTIIIDSQDEVEKYRSKRFNCGSSGLIISKIKIDV